MMKPLPTLAATAVILAACSAGGADTMAELMRDAGELLEDAGTAMIDAATKVDAAGPSDARAANDSSDARDARSDGDARDAKSDGDARDGAASGNQPTNAPPRALEANCSITRTVTSLRVIAPSDPSLNATNVTTTYYAAFDVADPTTVRLALVCDPVDDPVAVACPANDVPNQTTTTCSGFEPKGECVSAAIFSSAGKVYVSCGALTTSNGVTNKDPHYRKAKLVTDG